MFFEHCGEHGHCVGGAGVAGWCGPDQLAACLRNTDCMSGYCSSFTCTPDAPVPDNAVSDDPPGGIFMCLAAGANGNFVSARFVGASIEDNRPKCFYDATFQDGSSGPVLTINCWANGRVSSASTTIRRSAIGNIYEPMCPVVNVVEP